jgi:hypothetical protein
LNQRLRELNAGIDNLADLINNKFSSSNAASYDAVELTASTHRRGEKARNPRVPLLIADRTYNPDHPDYVPELVRNFPSKILNLNGRSRNAAFAELAAAAEVDDVPESFLHKGLASALVEASSLNGAAELFERSVFQPDKTTVSTSSHALHTEALNTALFLYWLIRRVKPRTIVQSGCSALASTFMILALAKNGPSGNLSILDTTGAEAPTPVGLPSYLSRCDDAGTLVLPEAYRNRVDIRTGSADRLLPQVIEELENVDLFYHACGRTYDRVIYELQEVGRKLNEGGLLISKDVAWNSAIWDFADSVGAPAYNFKGAMGVIFL